MSWRQKLRGFYAILDKRDRVLADLLVDPDGAGARVIQLRWKGSSAPDTRELVAAARETKRVASVHGALFIVNDRMDIALAVGADGVHLGQDDLELADALALRSTSGRADLLIGISTHDEDQVRAAVAGGADYLGYGPVFATATKENPDPVQGVDRLARAVELAGEVPVVAIGGVTPDNVGECARAGAHAACSIGAVNGCADPAAAGLAIAAVFAGGGLTPSVDD